MKQKCDWLVEPVANRRRRKRGVVTTPLDNAEKLLGGKLAAPVTFSSDGEAGLEFHVAIDVEGYSLRRLAAAFAVRTGGGFPVGACCAGDVSGFRFHDGDKIRRCGRFAQAILFKTRHLLVRSGRTENAHHSQ